MNQAKELDALRAANDRLVTDLIAANTRAYQVYLKGWEDGYLAGAAAQTLSNEDAADLAARRFIALQLLDLDIRREMKTTREFVDVRNARNGGKRAAA